MRVFAMMCATAVALVPSGASATNWVEVSRGENGMVSYIDTDGIRVLGSGRVRGWVKRDLSRVLTERAREFRQQWEWNCTDQTTTLLSYISYAPDGSVMNSETLRTYELETNPVAPDTVGETILEEVCRIACYPI